MSTAERATMTAVAVVILTATFLLLSACGSTATPDPQPPTQASQSAASSSSTPTVTVTSSAPPTTVTVTPAPVTATVTTTSIQSPPPPAEPTAPDAPVTAVVASVHDGDTFTLTSGDKVRVLGIDTPEVPPTGNDCYGEQAQAKARSLMPPGTQVTLQTDDAQGEGPDRTDPTGRLLRYVTTPSGDLATILLTGGYARVFAAFPVDRTPQYQALQDEAFAGQVGLWATPENQGCPSG